LPGPNDQLPYRAQRGNLRITCVGLQKDVRLYQGIGDVAINTSLHDSFNISLAEAMACEVPILTSDVAGVSAFIETYECGVTIPFRHNPVYTNSRTHMSETSKLELEGIVEWLIQLRQDHNLRRKLGARARQVVVKHCSDTVAASAWYALLGMKG
jgi:glycosyltransferase involved in cell wall biosynthesis